MHLASTRAPSLPYDDHGPAAPTAGIQLLCELAPLDKSSILVCLEAVFRMAEHGTTSETVPVSTIAEILGLHYNTVGRAYATLANHGLLKRVTPPTRGAPARTTLTGPTLELARALGSKNPIPYVAIPASVCSGVLSDSNVPARADRPHHQNQMGPGGPVGVQLKDSPAPAPHAVPTLATPRKPAFHYRQEVFDGMARKVPKEARGRALLATDPAALIIDPTWGLTPDEVEHYLYICPAHGAEPASRTPARPTATQPPPLPSQTSSASIVIDPALATRVSDAVSRLNQLPGSRNPAEIADEVAYSIAEKGLGRGNVEAGCAAALSLIRNRRWTTPRGMDKRWHGAVARTLSCRRGHTFAADEVVTAALHRAHPGVHAPRTMYQQRCS